MAVLREIITDRLRIVPFEEQHLSERYVRWLNDPEVVRYSEQRHRKHDLESCRAYLESIRLSDNYFCAIEETANGYRHIGNTTVTINLPNSLADISIMIGERAAWGAGLGFEAWTQLMRALLDREGIRKVTGGALADNLAMIRIMQKAGMAIDGRRRNHYLIDGAAVDIVYFATFSDS